MVYGLYNTPARLLGSATFNRGTKTERAGRDRGCEARDHEHAEKPFRSFLSQPSAQVRRDDKEHDAHKNQNQGQKAGEAKSVDFTIATHKGD
jgi:hypothetical protein